MYLFSQGNQIQLNLHKQLSPKHVIKIKLIRAPDGHE